MRSSPSTQRGAAFLSLVAVISAVAILFVIGQASWQAKQRANHLPQLRAERVEFAAQAIREWYVANAPVIDSPEFVAPTGEELLGRLGVPPQWLLFAQVSEPLVRGNIQYRVIGIWLEGEGGELPEFDPTTGEFTCPSVAGYRCDEHSIRVSGYEIQSELYNTTVRTLRTLARATQTYFRSLWLADPDHNLSKNYFRACDAPRTKLPCLDSWTEIAPQDLDDPFATVPVLEALGQPISQGYDAWGNPLWALNGGRDNASNPPFRMGYQARTPWGALITVYAVQQL